MMYLPKSVLVFRLCPRLPVTINDPPSSNDIYLGSKYWAKITIQFPKSHIIYLFVRHIFHLFHLNKILSIIYLQKSLYCLSSLSQASCLLQRSFSGQWQIPEKQIMSMAFNLMIIQSTTISIYLVGTFVYLFNAFFALFPFSRKQWPGQWPKCIFILLFLLIIQMCLFYIMVNNQEVN